MKRIQIDPIDALALVGLALIALGVAYRIGSDVALIVVGGAFLIYAILATRTGGTT